MKALWFYVCFGKNTVVDSAYANLTLKLLWNVDIISHLRFTQEVKIRKNKGAI